ncbi:MAG TPA: hypothetical protein VH062_21610 [Polyangiaceae bacterium]|jgi:hypothetical protein|nr:hypothetical protein [Polyangiaceae bacterium]
MLKRLVAALFEGAVPGAAVAFGLTKLDAISPTLMYAAVALVGVLTALVAGRPIWAKAAKVEALLKSVAGAFISVVVLYALRKWTPGLHVDLTALGLGAGPVGYVPWVALPATGVALATVLEIDDAFGPGPAIAPRRRVATGEDVAGHLDAEVDEDEAADRRTARR